jgi:hypothetical protein
MRPSSLLQGIFVAFGLSVLARPLLLVFSILSLRMDDQLFIASLTAAYILYMMSHRAGRVGRLTLAVLSWGLLFGACFMGASIGTLILLGVGLIWLVRSVLRYSSLLSALLDGLLCAVSLGGAAIIAMLTGSVALTVWGFFLCQALWVLIPTTFGRLAKRRYVAAAAIKGRAPDRFSRSYHAAEAAIRSLAQQDA